MKKFLQNVLLRSLCVLALGILLLVFSDDMSKWIVYASGGLFVVLGSMALIAYLRARKEMRPTVLNAVVSVGSILFGLVQFIFPDLFFGALRYLMAGVMFVLAIVQMYSLIAIRKGGVALHWTYLLFPLIGIGMSMFVIFYKKFEENDPLVMIVLGVGFVLYALLELWSIVLVKRAKVPVESEMLPEEIKHE